MRGKLQLTALKRILKESVNKRRLAKALAELKNRRPDAALVRLLQAWGNEGYAAKLPYLQAIAQHALRSKGPILECGSGASTLLLACLAGERVWTLEHLVEWHEKVRRALDANKLKSHLELSPLISYADFDWYSLPKLPEKIGLVICDGPPGTTRGGRYGMLPLLRQQLAPDCVILVDDAERDVKVLEQWAGNFGLRAEVRGCYAVCSFADALLSASTATEV